MRYRNQVVRCVILCVLLLVPLGCADTSSTATKGEKSVDRGITGLYPGNSAVDQLKPGLAVTYYSNFFKRDLNDLSGIKKGEFKMRQGAPILELNHQFDRGNVFDSGTNRGIAMRMSGYLIFPEPGDYQMQALSNDGIIIYLSDKVVLSDPKQHSDRLSDIAHVSVVKSGAVPVLIEYFQRKGTAAIKLFWKTPGSDEFVPVPKSAYAHQ